VKECVEVTRGSRSVLEAQLACKAALDQKSRRRVVFVHALKRTEERHRRDALAYAPDAESACFGVPGDQSTEMLLGLRLTPRWRLGAHRVGVVAGSNPASCMSSA